VSNVTRCSWVCGCASDRQWEDPPFGFLSVYYCLLPASFVSHRSSRNPPNPPPDPKLNSFYFWSEKFFVSSILYIYKKVQEESQWIANFIQWCEFRQLLLESFPSVITSSPSLPVNERERERNENYPSPFHTPFIILAFCNLLRNCALLGNPLPHCVNKTNLPPSRWGSARIQSETRSCKAAEAWSSFLKPL